MKKSTEITIRGYHIDFYGHVNNARYLEFFEEARWQAYGEAINSDFFKEKNLSFLVVNINVNYKLPVTNNQKIVIESSIKKKGTKSITLYQNIIIKETGQSAVDADVTFVIADNNTGKAVVLTEHLMDMFF